MQGKGIGKPCRVDLLRRIEQVRRDFGQLKDDIKKLADEFDHSLIIEDGTLKEKTVEALKEENFKMIFVDFRPTAESFAKYFYDRVKKIGYDVKLAKVYETPNNMAAYGE